MREFRLASVLAFESLGFGFRGQYTVYGFGARQWPSAHDFSREHSESITKALGEHSVLMPCGLRRRVGSSYIRGVVRTSLLGMQLVPILGTGVAVADFDGKPFGKEYLNLTKGEQITYQPPPPCPNPKAEWVYGRVGKGYSLGWFPNRLTRPDRTGCTFQHPI